MKIRFGALALVAVLAACSGQDQSANGVSRTSAAASAADEALSPAIAGYSNDSKRTLGGAPDRGDLFTYQKNASVVRHGAYTMHPVALSEDHAIRGVATGMMTIPTPDGSEIKIRYERHEESEDGNWSWIGRVVGGDQAREAIFTFGEQGVFGSIPQLAGPSLKLTTEHGIAYLVEADPAKLFKATAVGGDTRTVAGSRALSRSEADSLEAESLIAAAMQKAKEQAASIEPKAFTTSNTIDLVIGYSNGLASRLGSASAAITKLSQLVAVANTALLNSNINARIRVVQALQVTYADNTSNESALDQLTGHNGVSPVTVPAGLAPLRSARDQYGADLVTLIRDFTKDNGGCGVAWLNGANGAPITVAADAPFGYSVVSEGQYDESGNTYYCEDISLVHELAHNMGSAHDIANAPDDTGRYPYSYGYKTAAAAGNFFTVMAYGDNNQTLYRVFSSPDISTCGGRACGVANAADNARSLRQTIPLVTQFRNTKVPLLPTTAPDLYAVKKMANGGAQTEVQAMSSASKYKTLIRRLATPLGATGTDDRWNFQFGDYNGDGKPDLYAIKKEAGSNRVEVHVLDGARKFGVFLLRKTTILAKVGVDNRWIMRLGDYNRDGTLDIYAIDKLGSTGKTEVRVLNGADNFQSYLLAKKATAQGQTGNTHGWVFEVGDYNADGILDIYGINKIASSGKTEVHVLNGIGGFATYLAHSASVMPVTGADNKWDFKLGDYDKDGKLDVYGIKKVTGAGKTEIHALNAASNYKNYVLETTTYLGNTGTDSSWDFDMVEN